VFRPFIRKCGAFSKEPNPAHALPIIPAVALSSFSTESHAGYDYIRTHPVFRKGISDSGINNPHALFGYFQTSSAAKMFSLKKYVLVVGIYNKPSHGIIVSAVFSVLLIGLMYTLGNLQSIICFRFRSVSVSVSVVVAVAVGINARFVRRYVCGV
jgi:hypothetical protein